MRINNNVMALNAHRQLAVNQSNAAKSMERLSSGMRINRAGDDAAGLAISEKMRGQIRGLKQAQRNAQDGISLIQTAEGALNEIHAILQRMRELAVQSSTDTNTPEDRLEIQKEIDQLATEITRISTDTEFNTQNLLGGQFKAKFHIGANQGQNVDLAINAMDSDALGVAGTESAEMGSQSVSVVAATDTGSGFADGTYNVVEVGDFKGLVPEASDLVQNATHYLVNSNNEVVGSSNGGIVFRALGDDKSATVTFTGVSSGEITKVTISGKGTKAVGTVAITGDNNKLETGTYEVVDLKDHATYGSSGSVFGLKDASGNIVALGYKEGTEGNTKATTLEEVDRWVDVNDTTKSLLSHTAGINIDDGLKVGSKITVTGSGIDVSSQTSADKAIKTINDALETVSAERSKLGAMQNRLEHTIANLGTSAENLQAAESRIRDLDMAEEIMAFTKNNILQQAATAMLAQANMAPQSVLQLLG
jgi:flagellin